jgi:hypothetical protein
MTTKRYDCQAKYFLDPVPRRVVLPDKKLPQLVVEGKVGPHGLSRKALDLVDLGIFVYLLERCLPGKQQVNKLSKLVVRLGLREPEAWTPGAVKALEDLLLFMGGTYWSFEFFPDLSLREIPNPPKEEGTSVSCTSLFSGGLDSLCGASTICDSPDVRLVSFYTTHQKTLQRSLATDLGMPPPVQWRWETWPTSGRGRNFRYRSFFFLCLAAATAQSFGAHTILQFENGILASGIAPSLSIQVTKHAHYRLHRLCETIFSEVFQEPWTIDNPFRLMTKREAYQALEDKLGPNKASALASRTETCWNLYAGFVRKVDGKKEKKKNGDPCGFCVPCIIRQTAHPQPTWVDLRKDEARNDPDKGRYFREYFNLAQRIREVRKSSLGEFYYAMDTSILEALRPTGGYTLAELRDLFLRFSDEFMDTFFRSAK